MGGVSESVAVVACFRPFGGRGSETLTVLRTACSGPSRSTVPADALGREVWGGGRRFCLVKNVVCMFLLRYN